MTRRIDLTNERFGRLLVTDYSYSTGKHLYWNCKCDCGEDSIQCTTNLRRGNVVSCGCFRDEMTSKRSKGKPPPVKFAKGIASCNVLYGEYKHRAKRQEREFKLTKEEFKEITSSNCYYCGRIPKNAITRNRCNGEYIYNGIDRVDTKKGYFLDNCVPCCGTCNRMKLDHNIIDFLIHIEMIYEHIQENNLLGNPENKA